MTPKLRGAYRAALRLRAVALGEFLFRFRFTRRRSRNWLSRWRFLFDGRGRWRLGRLLSFRRRWRRRASFRNMLGHFHVSHLQIRDGVAQDGRFFVGEVTARFLLNHGELIDEELRQFQVDLALARFWIRNLAEKQRRILRMHHDKFDEPLRKLARL